MLKLKTKTNLGQSLVELVFAVGVVGMVLTGAVVLILNSLGSQSKKYDHKKASELAAMIVEDLVDQKNNDPVNFWQLRGANAGTLPIWSGFDGYTYEVVFTRVTNIGLGAEPGCSTSWVNCASATVRITWTRDNTKVLTVSRFFTRH